MGNHRTTHGRNRARWRAALGALAAAAMLLVSAAPAAAATPRQVSGIWAGTDVDASTQYLAVGPGLHMFYVDDGATVCLNAFGEFSPAVLAGKGSLAGDTLTVVADVVCLLSTGPQVVLEDLAVSFEFDAGPTARRGDDSLIDLSGCALTRIGTPLGGCP